MTLCNVEATHAIEVAYLRTAFEMAMTLACNGAEYKWSRDVWFELDANLIRALTMVTYVDGQGKACLDGGRSDRLCDGKMNGEADHQRRREDELWKLKCMVLVARTKAYRATVPHVAQADDMPAIVIRAYEDGDRCALAKLLSESKVST